MKLKEIQVGGRYLAKVSGRSVPVRVTELKEIPPQAWSQRDAWRTVIHAVNETTGRKISLRSAQRLRPLVERRRIGEVNQISDLAEGQRAWPEPDLAYDVSPVMQPPLGVNIEFVERRGEALVAHASDGRHFPVTGTGNYVLCPRNKQ